jgi:uncharacterized integral membrane protein
MFKIALSSMSSQDPIAEPIRTALSGNSGVILVLAAATLLFLLAVDALIATARVLLEPVFALMRTLFRLLLVLSVVVGIVLILASGSARAAGPADAGLRHPRAGTVP